MMASIYLSYPLWQAFSCRFVSTHAIQIQNLQDNEHPTKSENTVHWKTSPCFMAVLYSLGPKGQKTGTVLQSVLVNTSYRCNPKGTSLLYSAHWGSSLNFFLLDRSRGGTPETCPGFMSSDMLNLKDSIHT